MRKSALIIGASLGALLLAGLYVVLFVLPFRVTGTDPSAGSFPAINPYMIVKFNRPIADGAKVTSPDNLIVSSQKSGDSNLKIYLNPLTVDQEYRIVLELVTSTDGAKIQNKTITFTARAIEYDKLSNAAKGEIRDRQEVGDPETVNNEALNFLPYETLDYKIEAVVDNKVTLEITIFIAQAQMSSKDEVIATQKNEAKQYLSSKGINLDKYSVKYFVSDPGSVYEIN